MVMVVQSSVLILLTLFAAALVTQANSHSPWEDFQDQGGSNRSDWICHYKEGTGSIDKSRCASSCNGTADSKEWLGYVGAIVAIIFFGSNFVPVKKYETGDGIFFQWVMCIGLWLVGLVVNLALDSPVFFLPTVLGGVMWTTGNMLVVPIIQLIGLTMGLTVWGVTNMLSGWVVGRFILDQHVSCPGLSYGGVGLVVCSVLILGFVKSEGKTSSFISNQRKEEEGVEEKRKSLHGSSETSALLGNDRAPSSMLGSLRERLLQGRSSATNSINSQSDPKVTFSNSSLIGEGTLTQPADVTWVDKLKPWQKKILGFSLSLVAGLFFSLLFIPVQYLKLCNGGEHTCSDMNYLFGVYSGILFTSTFYMCVYSVIKRNKPKIYPQVIFPGLISGIMWGIAMLGWFLANQHLSLAISFPLVTAGPGFISSGWGILVYREIKGWRSLCLFFVAFCVSLSGQILNGLSRCRIHCKGK